MSNATHNNSFGLGLTDINEFRKRIIYMTYEIIVSSAGDCTIKCMVFSFHIQYNFYILDFYMNLYTILYQAFHILENLHILVNILIVSYFPTLSKLQYSSMINIGRRKHIYIVNNIINTPMEFINSC